MELVPVNWKTYAAFKKLYFASFPPQEIKPLWMMKSGVRRGRMEMLTLEENGFAGLIVTMLHGDLVLIDFLAVAGERRGTGVGSRALGLLRERYPGKRIVLEIEPPYLPADNTPQRIKRKAFYERNGFQDTGLKMVNFGNPLDILATGGTVTCEEVQALIAHVHGKRMYALANPHLRVDK